MGFHRADGQVGTANYWLVIPLVFCENRNVNVIRQAFEEGLGFSKPDPYKNYVNELVKLYNDGKADAIASLSLQESKPNGQSKTFKNIDGVKMLLHEGGCGGTRQDSETLCKLLAGYIHHPNVAGATVLSLDVRMHKLKSFRRSSLNSIRHLPNQSSFLISSKQEQNKHCLRSRYRKLCRTDGSQQAGTQAGTFKQTCCWIEMRWIGWFLRYLCQPCHWSYFRSTGYAGWQHDPL